MRSDPNYYVDLDGPYLNRRQQRVRRIAMAVVIAACLALLACSCWACVTRTLPPFA